ncbi:MAG: hypothetical protein WCK37_02080 [Candidatus Falkowbacteria bacterium]
MKGKIVILILALSASILANAQSDSTKLFQSVGGGMVVGTSATSDFSSAIQPFSLSYCLLANVTIVTPKTYHNLMYGFGNNSCSFLSGYFLPKDWDTYFVYSKSLNSKQDYLGIGLEKMIKAGDVACFLFSEVGTDFKNTKALTFGVLICVQSKFWKRKL